MRQRPPGGGGRCCIANIAMLAIVANIAMVANWAIVTNVDTGNWKHVGRRPTIFFKNFLSNSCMVLQNCITFAVY